MDISELAARLGGTINNGWINIPGPGHRSKDRSLGIKLDPSAPGGFRINSFAQDDPELCKRYVAQLLKQLGGTSHQIEPLAPEPVAGAHKTSSALAIWNCASPPEGTLVERYLNLRACGLYSSVQRCDAIRFHPLCPFSTQRVPSMLALMRHVITDEPTGIHRTALGFDGTARQELDGGAKRMLGNANFSAVKLLPHNGVLGIAEGIETALSASRLFSVPVWAMLSAGGIRTCPIVPTVKRLIIFADHDPAGMKAAVVCADRYRRNGIPAAIKHPPTLGSDFNDVLKENRK
jgi:hypothetical protein